MQATPSASVAADPSISDASGPAWGLKSTRHIWARATATWTNTLLCVAFVFAVHFVSTHFYTRSADSQAKPLLQLSSMLANDATIRSLDDELDSDEYEDEDQSNQSGGFLASSREREVLRRVLGREHGLTKRSSIVRITSSDPTSTLSEHPIQVDLDVTTKRSFWPAATSTTPPSASPTTATPPAVVPNSTPPTTKTASPTGSPSLGSTRRRKQSGALLVADSGRRQHSASPSRSPLGSSRTRAESKSPLGRRAMKRNSSSSFSSADRASDTKTPRPSLQQNDSWLDESQPAALGDQLQPLSPSMASEASFASDGHQEPSPFLDDEAALPSPTSSTFSTNSRAPSILKRDPQPFRTASLRDIDISYSLMQRRPSLPIQLGPYADPAALAQQQHSQLWQSNLNILYSSAPPPYQPSSPSSPSSPQPKARSVKLIEPDWREHLDTHIRARERLETATRFAAFKMSDPAFSANPEELDFQDFWFERFTQSTAAAGRDWDWRKRRARLQRAAALGMALNQTTLDPPLPTNLPGNVGKTDVQLQHEAAAAEAPLPAAQAAAPPSTLKQMPAAPLVSFTKEELQTVPQLSVDTEKGRRTISPRGSEAAASPTPMSPTPTGQITPLGGIFGAVLPSADSVSAVMAARMAQRRRASEDLSGTSDAASSAVLNRADRRRAAATASGALPSSPRREATSPLANSVSEFTDSSGDSPSNLGVPGRLSSLGGTVGKKVSLNNLRAGLRRGSSGGPGAGGDVFTESAGIELVPQSPDLDHEEEQDYVSEDRSEEGPRSSADMYRPPAPAMTRIDSKEGSLRGSKPQPSYRGGLGVSKLNSAPAATSVDPTWQYGDVVDEIKADVDRDSAISLDSSHPSDSLRRRMRSETDSKASSSSLSKRDSLHSTPPVAKARARNGSRSSIMRSASGASSALDKTARKRSTTRIASDSGSFNSSLASSRIRERREPDPQMQPEPAPRGMAQRARSASLSSNNSSLASGSRKSSRSGSFKDGFSGGLGMTSGTSASAAGTGTGAGEMPPMQEV